MSHDVGLIHLKEVIMQSCVCRKSLEVGTLPEYVIGVTRGPADPLTLYIDRAQFFFLAISVVETF